MLKSLELHNFLKHPHLLVEFDEGLNVVRGENEGGKSSMLEGLGYNWFGSVALAKTMDDTVHWGAKASELKTKSIFVADKVEYTCTRSSSGAELLVNGQVLVTGQAEVTAKIEQLFGLPPGKAMNIIFAEQNAVRGILSAGPTAAAEFVEKLGDFAQADQLVKQITDKLDNGSTKGVEEQIEELSTKLASLRELEDTIDISSANSAFEHLQAGCRAAQKDLEEATSKFQARQQEATITESRRRSLRQMLEQLRKVDEVYAGSKIRLEAACSALPEMRRSLDLLVGQQSCHTTYKAYQYLQMLPKFEDVWDGDMASLDAEIASVTEKITAARGDAKGLAGQRAGLALGRITKTKCPTCGTQLQDEAEVARKNAELDEKLNALSQEQGSLEETAQELNDELQLLAQVRNNGVLLLKEVDVLGGLVNIDYSTVPVGVAWVGPPPLQIKDPTAEINALRDDLTKAERAKEQLALLSAPDLSQAPDLEKELAALPPADENTLAAAHAHLIELRPRVEKMVADTKVAEDEFQRVTTQLAVCQDGIASAVQGLAALETKVKTLSANNALIKRVRAARLQVTERLWSHLLGTTSAFFSHFRGVRSEVTRGAKGAFVVDGKNSRPSGSTLDILGLSIRIAVARVFSKCGVLILDEPSAGCDARRTALMTSGLLSAGFDQVILVTHKDADEAAGGKLIQLGG
jgi:DNA repair exonuclease SbcCD ATPase subunit